MLILIASFLYISKETFASGRDIIIPSFIQFAFIVLVFVIMAIIKVRIAGKLMLILMYIFSAFFIFLLISNLPYRGNEIKISAAFIAVPIALTYEGYLMIKK